MKAARLIVMGTALAAAGGAGFLALNLFNREPEKQIVEVSKPSIEAIQSSSTAKCSSKWRS